jgi:exodeoxyribonuclease VII small subunit
MTSDNETYNVTEPATDLPTDKASRKPRSRKSAAPAIVEPTIDIPPNWTYEDAVAEVEAIVAQMEAGDLDLATVFSRFETAMGHLRRCKSFLYEKQQQVDLLLETLEDDVAF